MDDPDRFAGLRLEAARRSAAQELRAAGCPTPDLDVRAIFGHALKTSPERLAIDRDRLVSPAQSSRLAPLIRRRAAREPVSHLIGRREFYGRDFVSSSHALDPRPSCEEGIDLLLSAWPSGEAPCILEPGVGGGCLLLTLLCEAPQARGVGFDIDARALGLAAVNARRLGVADRLSLFHADWRQRRAERRRPLADRSYDVIVANPPYLPTGRLPHLDPEPRLYEPIVALDGGVDGLDAYRHLIPQAAAALKPGGLIAVESLSSQLEAIAGLFASCGLIPLNAADRREGRTIKATAEAGKKAGPQGDAADLAPAWTAARRNGAGRGNDDPNPNAIPEPPSR